MKKNLKTAGIICAAIGGAVNIVDTATAAAAGDPGGGIMYGPNGYLRGLNEKLPLVNVGFALILIGAGMWAYARFAK